uniref:Cholesterol side-chain cleavage enzyme, mitochondrial n=1 Tax=Phlebotomus papatasi TaxID=29031 RepID=A0A1B0CYX9_PHLPP
MFRVNVVHSLRKFCSFSKVNNGKCVLEFKDIPVAKGLPVIGTTLDIVGAGSAPKFHEYINERHKKLGSMFRERIGSLECLFISDPEVIREIFLHEGKYPRHPIPDAWKLYERKHRNKRGLLFMDGEDWLYHRKIMNTLLLNRDFSPFVDPIKNSVGRLMAKWEASEPIKPLENIESDLYRWSLETIINLTVGSAYTEIQPEIEESLEKLSRVLHRVFKTSAKLFLLPPQICEFLGTNGGTRALKMMLILLSKHPDVQENIRKEVVGRDSANADEIPILRATIRETLRLFPVAPFVGRVIGGKDTILGNYRIDQEVMGIVSLYTSSRDPRNFYNPNQFHPKRWMRSEGASEHKPQASLPFALGARSCIGQKIAMKQMCELLRQLLQHFHLKNYTGPVNPVLQLITVPDKKIEIGLRKIHL